MDAPLRIPIAGGEVDLAQRLVLLPGGPTHLTTKECEVLAYLSARPGQTVRREDLLVDVWGHPPNASTEPVFSTIKRLRAKIDQTTHRHIQPVHGEGYRYEPPATLPSPGPARDDLVGRVAERASLAEHLGSGARVVTLVGPGGAGKSRLARAWGDTAHGQRVAWCTLRDAHDEISMLHAVAVGLGVPLVGAEPAEWRQGISGALASAPDRLIVLDNVEPVADALAATLTAWAPAGRFVVTSQERLRIPGEVVVQVLPLPAEDALTLLRARLVTAGVAGVDAPTLTRIVDRLDRLPLALEIAAAQAGVLGIAALVEGLDRPLETLVVTPRAPAFGHASLRATVEASWRLLGDADREALFALASFEGGFTVAAAEAVLPPGDAGGRSPRVILTTLADRSLLRPVPGAAPVRFELYVAMRELARERTPDPEPIAARHAAWAAHHGEAAVRDLDGPEHLAAARSLQVEYTNLAAAYARRIGTDADLAARLALVLDHALGLTATSARVRRDRLAQARRAVRDVGLRARLLLAEGAQDVAGTGLLEDAATLFAAGGDRAGEAAAWIVVGARRARESSLQGALDALERARNLAESAANPRLTGRVLAALGDTWFTYGELTRALPLLEAALSHHRDVGDRRAEASTSVTLCHVYRLTGQEERARRALRDAEEIAEELGDPVASTHVLVTRALHLTRTGDAAGARGALTLAAARYEQLGMRRERALVHLHACEGLLCLGDFAAAEAEARLAVDRLRDLGADVNLSVALEALGCVLFAGGQPGALSAFEEGISLARAAKAARSEGTQLAKRGLVWMATGRYDEAWSDFDTSVRILETQGARRMAGGSLADRAMASIARGDLPGAEADLAAAWEALGRPREDTRAGRMLATCRVAGEAWGAWRTDPGGPDAALVVRAQALLAQVDPGGRDVPLVLAERVITLALAGPGRPGG